MIDIFLKKPRVKFDRATASNKIVLNQVLSITKKFSLDHYSVVPFTLPCLSRHLSLHTSPPPSSLYVPAKQNCAQTRI